MDIIKLVKWNRKNQKKKIKQIQELAKNKNFHLQILRLAKKDEISILEATKTLMVVAGVRNLSLRFRKSLLCLIAQEVYFGNIEALAALYEYFDTSLGNRIRHWNFFLSKVCLKKLKELIKIGLFDRKNYKYCLDIIRRLRNRGTDLIDLMIRAAAIHGDSGIDQLFASLCDLNI